MDKNQEGVAVICPTCNTVSELSLNEYIDQEGTTCIGCRQWFEFKGLKDNPKFLRVKKLKK